ncbi:FAD-dependent thymidylate synthase [bacterium]|nr:FAD-dependent thymidylate synthase [bacterium]
MYSVKILCDSVTDDVRLTTIEATFPRFILAEVNTHRMLSRNSASSRAIPVEKRIKAVRENPFVPEAFGKNQKGMQSQTVLDVDDAAHARALWLQAAEDACQHAELLLGVGVHKQWANRLLEPFGWQTAIISATEWENFLNLREHPDAQPEFRKIAGMIGVALKENTPVRRVEGDLHLPLIFEQDIEDCYGRTHQGENIDELLIKISVGRCARVSYLTHDGRRDLNADIMLATRLQASGHLSPFEHVAVVGESSLGFSGNFRKPWIQYRKTLVGEDVFRG